MEKYIKISIGIFFALAASRFVPHPPNFTSLIALSFYVPVILGINFIPVIILSFLITDIFLGFHNTLFFTWGCVAIIGYISYYFKHNAIKRLIGVTVGALLFFIITNFGVWFLGDMYAKNVGGFLLCYYFAIPFFFNSLVSTIIFSLVIEGLLKTTFSKNLRKSFK
tara:strand:+ start:3312 stop:3809 length:498 start_codon:yes stop_codon:yes gene_type:complete